MTTLQLISLYKEDLTATSFQLLSNLGRKIFQWAFMAVHGTEVHHTMNSRMEFNEKEVSIF